MIESSEQAARPWMFRLAWFVLATWHCFVTAVLVTAYIRSKRYMNSIEPGWKPMGGWGVHADNVSTAALCSAAASAFALVLALAAIRKLPGIKWFLVLLVMAALAAVLDAVRPDPSTFLGKSTTADRVRNGLEMFVALGAVCAAFATAEHLWRKRWSRET